MRRRPLDPGSGLSAAEATLLVGAFMTPRLEFALLAPSESKHWRHAAGAPLPGRKWLFVLRTAGGLLVTGSLALVLLRGGPARSHRGCGVVQLPGVGRLVPGDRVERSVAGRPPVHIRGYPRPAQGGGPGPRTGLSRKPVSIRRSFWARRPLITRTWAGPTRANARHNNGLGGSDPLGVGLGRVRPGQTLGITTAWAGPTRLGQTLGITTAWAGPTRLGEAGRSWLSVTEGPAARGSSGVSPGRGSRWSPPAAT